MLADLGIDWPHVWLLAGAVLAFLLAIEEYATKAKLAKGGIARLAAGWRWTCARWRNVVALWKLPSELRRVEMLIRDLDMRVARDEHGTAERKPFQYKGLRWVWTPSEGANIPHCEICFVQESGKLYPMAVTHTEDATITDDGMTFFRCRNPSHAGDSAYIGIADRTLGNGRLMRPEG